MPTIRFSRPFASGSRPTPDPFDKFLDSHGFYRKHTARDSSNLFRVVSEQLYDTQCHHKQVRKDCVNYMIKHRDQYETLIQEDFEKYVREMAKNETFGTLTELRAMGYLFKRNIKLFRPFDLGVWIVEDPDYTDPAMYVFHASHFDSVFEKSYIMDAAFCQSIVYEMLYKKVYKLPDIEYSVETMLHNDIKHEPSSHEYESGDAYATHIVFQDGRKFQLDRPENTLCILNDPLQCHFHNKNFEEHVKRDGKVFETSILSDKFCSCVRQLLFDGITPFPYKVAKALDENIYRNVEFDSWNEARKAIKSKQDHKAGVDCSVNLNKIEEEIDQCYINVKGSNGDMRPLSGPRRRNIVPSHRRNPYAKSIRINESSIDKYGYGLCIATSDAEDKVKFDDLVFDFDAIRDISKTLDFESYINLSDFKFSPSNNQDIIAYPMVYSQTNSMSTNNSSGNTNMGGSKKNRNLNTSNQSNMQCESNDKQQHVKIDTEENSYGNIKQDSQQTQQSGGYYQHQSQDHDAGMPTNQQPVPDYYHQSTTAPIYYCPTPEYNESNVYSSEMVIPHGVYAVPTHAYQIPAIQPNNMYAPVAGNQHYPVHVGSWPGYNPQGYVFPGPPQYAVPTISAPIPFQLPFLNRELLRSNGRINFNPNYSSAPSGEDLPLNDKVSVRFYYNLGVEYFKLLQQIHGHGQLMAMIDGEPCVGSNYDPQVNDIDTTNRLFSDIQHMNFESNEIEIQSPTKPRSYNDNAYSRRGANTKYNKQRNDNRSNGGKHFQGSFVGPTSKPPFSKNNQKYSNNQGGYDSTPVKDTSGKSHQQGLSIKREPANPDNENSNGFNVPPFPFFNETNDLNQHYGPPGNVYPRTTPPVNVGRLVAVSSNIPTTYHHQSNYWVPPNSHQVQQQQQQQHQQNQSHSLNTSAASNPSQ